MELLIFPSSSVNKELTCNAGDPGLIPMSGKSPGEGKGNPFEYSCLGNPMDSGTWQAAVHGVARVGHELVTKPQPPSTCRGKHAQGLLKILKPLGTHSH